MAKAVQEKLKQGQAALDQRTLSTLFAGPHGEVYRLVVNKAKARGVLFALGGGFAVNAYTGSVRATKDLDVYVTPPDREAMVEILNQVGMSDYYEQEPYDRNWIYRGYARGAIVDVIWAMANQVAQVDEAWLTRGPKEKIEDLRLRLLAPEELLWTKLYVIQRDRCDWPDVLNLIYFMSDDLDWEYLLNRLGDDVALLTGVLSLFAWLCPGRARTFPDWLWRRLNLIKPPALCSTPQDADCDRRHVGLIDSRPWFIPALTPELAQ